MGKWKMASFDSVFEDVTRYGTKIKKEDYLAAGLYQIIDQGKEPIAGYTNNSDGIYNDVPVVLFGDHTRIVKYIDSPLFLGADGVKLLHLTSTKNNTKFMYYCLSSARIPDTGYNRHFKWLKELTFPEPPLDVQQKIADVLDKASALIELRKAQLDKLNLLIKARFIEMFGDPIINSRKWPIMIFSDIATSRLGKMLDAKKQTGMCRRPYLANFNVQWFHFELDDLNEMDFDEADRAEFELKKGDLLVCEGGEVGRCAIWNNELPSCYFQKAVHRVRCNEKLILPQYLAYTFYYHSQYNGFRDAISGVSTIAHLPGERLKKLNIVVPPIQLQNEFVDFIQQVDKSKSALHQSLEKLELNYKSLMQKCFRGELF